MWANGYEEQTHRFLSGDSHADINGSASIGMWDGIWCIKVWKEWKKVGWFVVKFTPYIDVGWHILGKKIFPDFSFTLCTCALRMMDATPRICPCTATNSWFKKEPCPSVLSLLQEGIKVYFKIDKSHLLRYINLIFFFCFLFCCRSFCLFFFWRGGG